MRIRVDSLLHFETSALIVVCVSLLLPWWAAALVALAFGVGKEIWDRYHGGTPSWDDIIWDVIGIMLGVAITLVILLRT